MEFFHQKKDRKSHKDLSPGPSHECEKIEEPVSLPKYHFLVLWDNLLISGVPGQGPYANYCYHPPDNQICLRKIEYSSQEVDKDTDADI